MNQNRFTRKSLAALLVSMSMVALGSCEDDNRTSYVRPPLDTPDLATLRGGFGYYISEIDGHRVDGTGANFGVGGDTVEVTPGRHELVVYLSKSPGAPGGAGIGVSISLGEHCWTFDFDAAAGHEYEFGCRNLFNTALKITDKQTNEVIPYKVKPQPTTM